MSEIRIYTDGACKGNPGPGGWACVILDETPDQRRPRPPVELSGGYRLTTNNRMEMLAVIEGLHALDVMKMHADAPVTVFTDSMYIVDAVNKGWAKTWRMNNWMRNPKENAKNPDLWERVLDQCESRLVKFRWVKGHSGDRWNDRCDELAVKVSQRGTLPRDTVYEGGRDGQTSRSR